MKILAITGSLRKASLNTELLEAMRDMAPGGMEIEIARLDGIPLYDGDDEDANGKPGAVTILDARIKAADGVIIATPEYNFSIPGVLKNATDWLSRHSAPFKHKPVGIVGASQGPVGTARAQYHLRQNLQGMEALVMPKPEVFVGQAQDKLKDGKLTDPATKKVIAGWLDSYSAWVRKYA